VRENQVIATLGFSCEKHDEEPETRSGH
jgi:hypothetical protein